MQYISLRYNKLGNTYHYPGNYQLYKRKRSLKKSIIAFSNFSLYHKFTTFATLFRHRQKNFVMI